VILKKVYVALKSFKEGLSVSSNLVLTGWDTHGQDELYQINGFYILY
jgi:hypothetical protein